MKNEKLSKAKDVEGNKKDYIIWSSRKNNNSNIHCNYIIG